MEIKVSMVISSEQKLGDFLKETNSSKDEIIEFTKKELTSLFSEKYIDDFKINFVKIIDEEVQSASNNTSRKKKKRK